MSNYSLPPVGFGSYLEDILPHDIAVSAGAFAAALQQVKNIQTVDFEKFSQVVSSVEVVTKDLNLINGTDVPTDTTLATSGQNLLALGSGPNGTYTASDMFGCMSGLPYSWQELQNSIQAAQTTKLTNIYDQLYLATSWEGATVSVQYTTAAGPLYTITGLTITDSGGGYGRGAAATPTITIAGGSGATATCTIGIDPTNAGSNGSGEYGRVLTVTLTSAGSATGTIPTATIQAPPTATLPVASDGTKSTSGVNTASGTAGWPGMQTVVTDYITQANTEITAIQTANPTLITNLNTIYNAAGNQLMIEQRSRYYAIPPVPVIRDTKLNQYPTTLAVFTDALTNLAMNTFPHMYAQTLEAISDLSTAGGQSVVGLMRQERNAARLQELGIQLDNNIPVADDNVCPVLISNGTVPTATTGIEVPSINGDIQNPTTTFTIPSILLQTTDQLIAPKPYGYFDPNTNQYILTNNTTPIGSTTPIQDILNVGRNNVNNVNLLGPSNNGTGPAKPINIPTTFDSSTLQTGTTEATSPQQNTIQTESIAIVKVGTRISVGQGTPMDIGKPDFPGSLAGSPATNLLPCTLNSAYTSSTLLPNSLTVQEAIDEVIKCNCDCWVD
jgi:hypothetical protein